MPKDIRGHNKSTKVMEGNYLTAGDLALIENRRGYGYGDGYGYGHCGRGHYGAATTGVALGASALGAAVIGIIAVGWGLNQASRARSRAAENLASGNSRAIDILANQALAERSSREGWQLYHAPSMTQYVDVSNTSQSGAGAGATANALATAEALALINNQNNGINSAIGGCNFLRIARVSGSKLCGCDTCEG